MKLLKNTYKTLVGFKEIIELEKNSNAQYLIYQDNSPKYFVDLYDLSIESNSMMNSLVLCAQRPIEETLELLNKRNNINLSIPKASKFWFKKKVSSKEVKLNLEPLPEEWLAYSL